MQVVIGGASGFLGTALTQHLRQRGHQVTRLVRSGDPADDTSLWDPYTVRIDQIVIDRADAVVNLSGASVSRWPRTAEATQADPRVPHVGHRHARQGGRRFAHPTGADLGLGHVLLRRRPR